MTYVPAGCFALKVDQSVLESFPVFEADATGKLNATVFVEAVIVKSVPVVEDAKRTVGPVWVCPAGPSAVTAAVRYVLVSILRVPFPLDVLTKPFEVRFESLVMLETGSILTFEVEVAWK